MQLVLVALILALMGLTLLVWSWRERLATGLPQGRLVYADTGAWQRCMSPLFSSRYQLAGKPDYLVEERGRVTPVEVKPGRTAPEPFEGDVLQLASYCLLMEEVYGCRPRYGYIKYAQGVFRIDYTDSLRRKLLGRLDAMHRDLEAHEVPPSHAEPQRCLGCGHRQVCDERLA